ncbi:MAG: IS1380 family transposase [Alphaproteobacteria bacterium]|nr:MAG: IS1380 family transposase [Alphaproteobacteria bacterium]
MSDCIATQLEFAPFKRRRIHAEFSGGDVSSDGGVLLLQQLDRRLGLLQRVAAVVTDPRDPQRITHSVADMLKQRVFGLCLGYEDLNDHGELRRDVLMQTTVERDTPLASAPTLCRLENHASCEAAWRLHEVIVESFIASFKAAPTELVLDFDANGDPLHGQQEGRFFHGYYDHYCFLPLYVFCGEQLLVSYLRPSKIDAAKHAWAILALLVKRLRHAWPLVKIILRADSGFCRHRLLTWCERHSVGYVLGLAKNRRLNGFTALARERLAVQFEATQLKQREFTQFYYAARTWDEPRRVIARLEYGAQGDNPRYIVTNLDRESTALYDALYCARGEMENRIKEAQRIVRRPHQLPLLRGQSVPAAARQPRLHPHGATAQPRARRHRVRRL